jgi:hypothetical protein
MLQGLQKFIEGTLLRRTPLPSVDLSLRKLAALEALSRYTKLAPPLVGSISIEPNLWPTSALLDWWSVLHRVSGMPQRAARLREVEHIVRSRLNLQGTTMGFSTENADGLWWLMTSADENAVRLPPSSKCERHTALRTYACWTAMARSSMKHTSIRRGGDSPGQRSRTSRPRSRPL